MAKMKLPKPSAETIAYFERIAPGPPIEARKMFGMPVRFLNGHMLVGLFGDTFMLHLSASDREECIRAGAKPFAPMGRESKSYVDVKPGTFDDRTLKEWIVRGMRYLGSLPPKLKAKPNGAEPKRAGAAKRGAVTTKRNNAPARQRAVAKKPGRAAPKKVAAAKKAPPKKLAATKKRPAPAKKPTPRRRAKRAS